MRRGGPALVLLAAGAALCASCALQLPATTPPVPPTQTPAAPTPPAPATEPETPPVPVPVPAPSIPVHEGEPLITVGLAWDLSGVTLDPQGTAVVEGAGWHELGRDDQLVVAREGRWAVARGASPRGVRWSARIERGETLTVTPAAGTTTRWNGRHWRGQMRIFLNPRGRLTLAARLPLEQYLAGVLPGEIGALSDEVMEAGRAQAIAARSYTLFYRGRRAAEGFDVYGTVEDQVYGSVEGERPLTSRCVESTAGQVALFEGLPIRANYCSTCGGITADVWEAWPADPLDYLVGRRDRAPGASEAPGGDYCATSRHHRWREEWPATEFLANLDAFGPTYGVPLPAGGVGRLVDVRVEARSRSGRVWRLVVETTTGRMVVPAWSLRQVLRRPGNTEAILRSNLFKVDVRRDLRDGRALAVVASGAGSGHGVGLCQTGALAMARQGRTAPEILGHYYQGSIVRRLY